MILDIDVPPRVWPWLQVQTTSSGAEAACDATPDPFTGLELLPDALGISAATLPLLRSVCTAVPVESALLRRGAIVVNQAGRVGVVLGAYRVAQPAGRRFGMCLTSPAWWVEGWWAATVTATVVSG